MAVSAASRGTRGTLRTRSTCRTDSDSIVCATRCYRRTCISAAKVTFGAVTVQRWAVAVSLLARHEARHARHYPIARADSHSLADMSDMLITFLRRISLKSSAVRRDRRRGRRARDCGLGGSLVWAYFCFGIRARRERGCTGEPSSQARTSRSVSVVARE